MKKSVYIPDDIYDAYKYIQRDTISHITQKAIIEYLLGARFATSNEALIAWRTFTEGSES